jgi:hypothetical protein
LNNVEARGSERYRAEQYNKYAGEVDSKLELHKLANVVDNVTTPANGEFNGTEIVIKDNDIGVFLSS